MSDTAWSDPRPSDTALVEALDAYRSVTRRLGFSPGSSRPPQPGVRHDVLVLGSFKPYTGISRYAETVVAGLTARGLRVHLAGLGQLSDSMAGYSFTSLHEEFIGSTASTAWRALIRRIDDLVREVQPRVILTNRGFPYGPLAPRAAEVSRRGIPVVAFFPGHHTEMDLLEGHVGEAWRKTVDGCACLVGISQFVSGLVQHALRHPDVRTVRAGYDPQRFVPDPGWTVPTRAEEARLAYVGRLDQDKRPDLAVGAVVELARRGLFPTLDVYGAGDMDARLRESAGSQIQARITFHGAVAAEDVVASHHLVIVPSRYEGLGLQAIEAVGAGVPVVAHETGGLAETLAISRAGVAVEDLSEGAFADVIQGLLSDEVRLARLRDHALAYRESGTDTWATAIDKWVQLVEEFA